MIVTNCGMTEKLDISGYLIPVDRLKEMLKEQGYHLVTDDQMALLTVTGYMSRYYENISITNTYIAAWEATEDEFREVFNRPRFDSYNSFRASSQVQRYLKKK